MNGKREKIFSLIIAGVVIAAANTTLSLGGGLLQFAEAQRHETNLYCFGSADHEICSRTQTLCEQDRVSYERHYPGVETTPCVLQNHEGHTLSAYREHV